MPTPLPVRLPAPPAVPARLEAVVVRAPPEPPRRPIPPLLRELIDDGIVG